MISANIAWSNSGAASRMVTGIFKNGSEYQRCADAYDSASTMVVQNGCVLVVGNGTDSYDVRVYHDRGSDKDVLGSGSVVGTQFQAIRLN
jgi:hypothetical protein